MFNTPQVNPRKLFIGNLPYSATEKQLRDLFSVHGVIMDLKLITDRFTGQSKGIAFIEFSTEEQAKAAIAAVNETELDERRLMVSVAKPPKPRDDNNFGGSSGGGRRPNRY